MKFTTGTRVHLSQQAAGTITRIEAHRFRVTWDSHSRKAGESRLRTWHPRSEQIRFRLGNPEDG